MAHSALEGSPGLSPFDAGHGGLREDLATDCSAREPSQAAQLPAARRIEFSAARGSRGSELKRSVAFTGRAQAGSSADGYANQLSARTSVQSQQQRQQHQQQCSSSSAASRLMPATATGARSRSAGFAITPSFTQGAAELQAAADHEHHRLLQGRPASDSPAAPAMLRSSSLGRGGRQSAAPASNLKPKGAPFWTPNAKALSHSLRQRPTAPMAGTAAVPAANGSSRVLKRAASADAAAAASTASAMAAAAGSEPADVRQSRVSTPAVLHQQQREAFAGAQASRADRLECNGLSASCDANNTAGNVHVPDGTAWRSGSAAPSSGYEQIRRHEATSSGAAFLAKLVNLRSSSQRQRQPHLGYPGATADADVQPPQAAVMLDTSTAAVAATDRYGDSSSSHAPRPPQQQQQQQQQRPDLLGEDDFEQLLLSVGRNHGRSSSAPRSHGSNDASYIQSHTQPIGSARSTWQPDVHDGSSSLSPAVAALVGIPHVPAPQPRQHIPQQPLFQTREQKQQVRFEVGLQREPDHVTRTAPAHQLWVSTSPTRREQPSRTEHGAAAQRGYSDTTSLSTRRRSSPQRRSATVTRYYGTPDAPSGVDRRSSGVYTTANGWGFGGSGRCSDSADAASATGGEGGSGSPSGRQSPTDEYFATLLAPPRQHQQQISHQQSTSQPHRPPSAPYSGGTAPTCSVPPHRMSPSTSSPDAWELANRRLSFGPEATDAIGAFYSGIIAGSVLHEVFRSWRATAAQLAAQRRRVEAYTLSRDRRTAAAVLRRWQEMAVARTRRQQLMLELASAFCARRDMRHGLCHWRRAVQLRALKRVAADHYLMHLLSSALTGWRQVTQQKLAALFWAEQCVEPRGRRLAKRALRAWRKAAARTRALQAFSEAREWRLLARCMRGWLELPMQLRLLAAQAELTWTYAVLRRYFRAWRHDFILHRRSKHMLAQVQQTQLEAHSASRRAAQLSAILGCWRIITQLCQPRRREAEQVLTDMWIRAVLRNWARCAHYSHRLRRHALLAWRNQALLQREERESTALALSCYLGRLEQRAMKAWIVFWCRTASCRVLTQQRATRVQQQALAAFKGNVQLQRHMRRALARSLNHHRKRQLSAAWASWRWCIRRDRARQAAAAKLQLFRRRMALHAFQTGVQLSKEASQALEAARAFYWGHVAATCFNRLRSYAVHMRHKRRSLKLSARHHRFGVMRRALFGWIEFTLRKGRARVADRLRPRRLLHHALCGWYELAVAEPRIARFEAASLLRKVRRAFATWHQLALITKVDTARLLGKTFGGWWYLTNQHLLLRSRLPYFAAARLQRQLRQAFEAWRAHTAYLKQFRLDAPARAEAYHATRLMRAALVGWRDRWPRYLAVEQRLNSVVHRHFCETRVRRCLAAWREMTAQHQSQARDVAQHTHDAAVCRRAWRGWLAAVDHGRRKRQQQRTAEAFWWDGAAAKVLQAWQGIAAAAVQICIRQHELKRLMQQELKQRTAPHQAAVEAYFLRYGGAPFAAWHECTRLQLATADGYRVYALLLKTFGAWRLAAAVRAKRLAAGLHSPAKLGWQPSAATAGSGEGDRGGLGDSDDGGQDSLSNGDHSSIRDQTGATEGRTRCMQPGRVQRLQPDVRGWLEQPRHLQLDTMSNGRAAGDRHATLQQEPQQAPNHHHHTLQQQQLQPQQKIEAAAMAGRLLQQHLWQGAKHAERAQQHALGTRGGAAPASPARGGQQAQRTTTNSQLALSSKPLAAETPHRANVHAPAGSMLATAAAAVDAGPPKSAAANDFEPDADGADLDCRLDAVMASLIGLSQRMGVQHAGAAVAEHEISQGDAAAEHAERQHAGSYALVANGGQVALQRPTPWRPASPTRGNAAYAQVRMLRPFSLDMALASVNAAAAKDQLSAPPQHGYVGSPTGGGSLQEASLCYYHATAGSEHGEAESDSCSGSPRRAVACQPEQGTAAAMQHSLRDVVLRKSVHASHEGQQHRQGLGSMTSTAEQPAADSSLLELLAYGQAGGEGQQSRARQGLSTRSDEDLLQELEGDLDWFKSLLAGADNV